MSLLTELSGVLAPLVVAKRPTIDCVRFVGSETELCAFATNGHVLVLIVVLGDFSHVGDVLLPGDLARRIGARDWSRAPWRDPEQDRDLAAERHLYPVREHFLTLEKVSRVMPRSRSPVKSVGFFLGPALRTMSRVVARLGLGVQLSGSGDDDWMAALRADSQPFRMKNGSVAWLSAAVMSQRSAAMRRDTPAWKGLTKGNLKELTKEAKAESAALRAEVERLTKERDEALRERDEATAALATAHRRAANHEAERDALRVRVERLEQLERAALDTAKRNWDHGKAVEAERDALKAALRGVLRVAYRGSAAAAAAREALGEVES